MLIINEVTVTYDSIPALNNLSLQLAEGKIHGIVGPNGAGKTTLLNTLYGLQKPEHGSFTWENRQAITTDLGYLPAENYFYPLITGREYLQLFCLSNPDFRIDGWNELFGLPLDDFIDTYSTGMKKKLALMGVFALNRDILMLDEPFNSIDLESSEFLKKILRQLAENGKTIVLTSHILETMTLLCDEIHLLDNGRLVHSFQKDEFSRIHDFLFRKTDELTDELVKGLLRNE